MRRWWLFWGSQVVSCRTSYKEVAAGHYREPLAEGEKKWQDDWLKSKSLSSLLELDDPDSLGAAMSWLVTDGESTGPFKMLYTHLGPSASISEWSGISDDMQEKSSDLLIDILVPNLVEQMEEQPEEQGKDGGEFPRQMAYHLLTSAHLLQTDFLKHRLLAFVESCEEAVRKIWDFDPSADHSCFETALAVARETRVILNRKLPQQEKKDEGEKSEDLLPLTLLDVSKLYYEHFTLEQPYLCAWPVSDRDLDQNRVFLSSHIEGESQFVQSLGHLLETIVRHARPDTPLPLTDHDAKKYRFESTKDFLEDQNLTEAFDKFMSLEHFADATMIGCLPGESLRKTATSNFTYLLLKWLEHRLPALTMNAADHFARKVAGSVKRRTTFDGVFQREKAFTVLAVALNKEVQSEDISLSKFLEQHAGEILMQPRFFLLWTALDGASWRAQQIRKNLQDIELLQCSIFANGQAFEHGPENLVAGGAMWCSPKPANLMHNFQLVKPRSTQLSQGSIANIKEKLRTAAFGELENLGALSVVDWDEVGVTSS